MHRSEWPLIGRADTVEHILDQLDDAACSGVLIVGERGVGVTRVLDEVLQRLRDRGRDANRIVGTPAAREVPFAAIAHSLPGGLANLNASSVVELYEGLSTILGARKPWTRFVSCVDEISHVDSSSMALLSQMLAGRHAVIVGTLRTDTNPSDDVASLETSFGLRRVVIEPLPHDAVVQLIDAVLAAPVDGASAHQLAMAAEGNPFLLAELLDGSRASGALRQEFGTWTLVGEMAVTAQLGSVFAHRLGTLDSAERDLLELLALCDAVPLTAIDRAGLLPTAAALDSAGFLGVGPDVGERLASHGASPPSMVRVTPSLLGAHLRSTFSPIRRRALVRRAIDLVTLGDGAPDDRRWSGERGSSDDAGRVRLVMWQLEAGDDVPAATLREAADAARRRHDFAALAELTSAEMRQAPTLDAVLQHAEALHDLCRFTEAADLIEQAAADAVDAVGALRVAIARHRVRLWGRNDIDGSLAALQEAVGSIDSPILRDLARVGVANTVVFTGRVPVLGDVVASIETEHDLVSIGLMFPQSVALTLTGRVDDGLLVGREGVRRRKELADDAPVGHPCLFDLALGLALCERGDLDEADEVLLGAYRRAAQQRIPQLHTWLALSLGRVALTRGSLSAAHAWFVEAHSVATRAGFTMGRRIALTGITVSAAQLGLIEQTLQADADLQAMPADHGLLWPERRLGQAWVQVVRGSIADAVELLLAGADEAAQRTETAVEAELLYEAARLAPDRVKPMQGRLTEIQGPLSRARASFVEGVVHRAPTMLDRAERAFGAMGALIAAAESATELGRLLERDGQTRAARAAGRRADGYVPSAERPPHLRFGAAPHTPLSPREREVATRAATGMPSKRIAKELGLSVRTVSNHLQNAYVKLGVSGRDDLAEALDVDTTGGRGS